MTTQRYGDQADIDLVDLSGIGDHDVEGSQIKASWADVVEMMSHHEVRQEKSGLCFIPVKMKARDKWKLSKPRGQRFKPTYRNDANIAAVTIAVLDLDVPGARQKAEALFAPFEYVLYSTHNYTHHTPYKYRMVMRLDGAVPAEEWPRWFASLIAGIDADKTCGNLSRLYFYPSISPDAGVSPVVSHHRGRAFGHDDMMALERKFGTRHLLVGKGQYDHDSPWWSSSQTKRHFSGGRRSPDDRTIDDVDQSYDAFCRRHAKLIDEDLRGAGESRHNFALRAISREFVLNRSKTNLFMLLQFIYRAAGQFSSKPLYRGDTPIELPEMITSAMAKYDIAPPDDAVHAAILRLIQRAEQCAITGRWEFPPPNMHRRSAMTCSDRGLDYTTMRMTHIEAMRALARNGDAVEFARRVVVLEHARRGMEIDLSVCAQFIFRALAGYETSQSREALFSENMPAYRDTLIASREAITTGITARAKKPDAAFEFGVRLACASALGERPWQLPEGPIDSPDVAQTPGG